MAQALSRTGSIFFPENGAIIISRPDRIGDSVISSSCLPWIRKRWPQAFIYYLVQSSVRPLFEGLDCIDGIIDFDPAHGREASINQLFHAFKKIAPYAIVHLQPNLWVNEASYRFDPQIPLRIGWTNLQTQKFLTHSLPDQRALGLCHEAESNFKLLSFIDIPPQPRDALHAVIEPSHEAIESLRAKMESVNLCEKFIAIHPLAAKEIKCWPIERFAELTEWLTQKLNLPVASIGGSQENPAIQAFQKLTKNLDILRLEGTLNLPELSLFLRDYTCLLITADSGPAHIAASVDCPQIVLYGRTEPMYGPTRWRPLSSQSTLIVSSARKKWLEPKRTFWKRSFDAIQIDTLKEAIEQSLSSTSLLPCQSHI